MHNSRYLYTIRAPAIHNSASATLDRACRYAIRHATRRAYSALRYCGNCPLNALGRGIRRRATVADESLRRLSAAPPRPHLTKPGHLYTIRACYTQFGGSYTQFGSSYTQFGAAIHTTEASIHNSRRPSRRRTSHCRRVEERSALAPDNGGRERRAGPGSSEYRAAVSVLHPRLEEQYRATARVDFQPVRVVEVFFEDEMYTDGLVL